MPNKIDLIIIGLSIFIVSIYLSFIFNVQKCYSMYSFPGKRKKNRTEGKERRKEKVRLFIVFIIFRKFCQKINFEIFFTGQKN